MKIKFLKHDPRAGMEAVMDSSRGQQLIDAGSAVQVSESADAKQAEVHEVKADAKPQGKAKAKGKDA